MKIVKFAGVMTIVFLLILWLMHLPVAEPILLEPTEGVTRSIKSAEPHEKRGGIFQPPLRTNVLIEGIDQENMLSDAIMICSFHRGSHEISILSVPRDTYIGLYGYAKINALHYVLKEVLEDLLGLEIHYTVQVSLEAFREIVDAAGGVEMEIPAGGLYYYDPTQDLRINIPGGHQVLDGELAEGLVRYRQYRYGDLQRIEMQQQFLIQMFDQVLSKESITKNLPTFLYTALQHVKTDLTILELLKYIRYLDDLSPQKFYVYTLPGTASYINDISYFMHDPEQTEILIKQIFYE